MKVSNTIVERFWTKIEKEKSSSGCWNWTAQLNNKGYGMLGRGSIFKGSILAHRFSYLIHAGKIKKTDCVCHSCDNPKCVNPKHLWVGSHKENTQDMIRKGRYPDRKPLRGELHPLHKLTENKVKKIRKCSIPQRELAKVFGVSQTTIWRAKNKISWPGV